MHWVCVKVEPEDQKVTIYDSLAYEHRQIEGIFSNFFTKLARKNQNESLLTITYAASPRQQDESSCGLFTISNILCLAGSRPLEDLQSRLESVRRSILYAVVFQPRL